MPLRRLAPLSALLLLTPSALAQPSPLGLTWSTGEQNPTEALIPLDLDDDNDDGVPDCLELQGPDPAQDNEVVSVQVTGAAGGALQATVTGGVRIVTQGGLVTTARLPVTHGRVVVPLVGVSASRAPRDASLTVTSGGVYGNVALTVGAAVFLHGDNAPVFPHRDALSLSHAITNDLTLPRAAAWGERSPDPDDVRLEVWDPGAERAGTARVEATGSAASIGVRDGGLRGLLAHVAVRAPEGDLPLRSRHLRLVGDDLDLRAPGVQDQVILVGLRDRVTARYRRPGVAGELTVDARVGRPGNEDGPLAARRASWHVVVMRDRPAAQGGRPLVGNDDAGALRIAREQVAISNEVYVQCMITFGDPATASVVVADPPPPSLLSIGDNDGYHALGGVVRFSAGGRVIGPVIIRPGWRPVDTARAIASALGSQGFWARLTLNPRTDYGADRSADLLVRDPAGRLAVLTPVGAEPLTTDRRQSVQIGRVDFTDGLDEFNNLNSSSGTLEERALIKPLMDEDLTTIDLFIVNRFGRGTRIGEAFVEGDSGAVLNALLLDRAGLAAQRDAWTQSHEAGHILLNQPWHPDNMGPDRPWLLMDADASLGAVTGPKRLTREECQRITEESGVHAVPPLLAPYDPHPPSPRAASVRTWPAEALYPRPERQDAPTGPVAAPPRREQSPSPPAREFGLGLSEGG